MTIQLSEPVTTALKTAGELLERTRREGGIDYFTPLNLRINDFGKGPGKVGFRRVIKLRYKLRLSKSSDVVKVTVAVHLQKENTGWTTKSNIHYITLPDKKSASIWTGEDGGINSIKLFGFS